MINHVNVDLSQVVTTETEIIKNIQGLRTKIKPALYAQVMIVLTDCKGKDEELERRLRKRWGDIMFESVIKISSKFESTTGSSVWRD